jgi:hypothetical protein
MKRILTIAFALLVAAAPVLAENHYGWKVSASSSDPDVATGNVPTGVPANLYLWYACNGGDDPTTDGLSAADFGVLATGIFATGFTPANGFLNAGAFPNLLLAVGGCPDAGTAGIMAGSIAVFYLGGAGSCCLVNSNNGINVSVDCVSPIPSAWPNTSRGWDAVGWPACDDVDLCPIVAVEPQSWGSVKSLYR